jgi:hypothetical protein
MVSPESFFEAVAAFEPYNQHFLQDIGAFQVGLGVVLLLAGVSSRTDGLTIALIGVGVAVAFHTVSHVVGRQQSFDIRAENDARAGTTGQQG